jgi:hypothetical protein
LYGERGLAASLPTVWRIFSSFGTPGCSTASISSPAGQGREPAAGPLPAPLVTRLRNQLFLVSLRSRVGIVLGTVYLMTGKPDLPSSLLTVGVALAAGLAWARAHGGLVPGRPSASHGPKEQMTNQPHSPVW